MRRVHLLLSWSDSKEILLSGWAFVSEESESNEERVHHSHKPLPNPQCIPDAIGDAWRIRNCCRWLWSLTWLTAESRVRLHRCVLLGGAICVRSNRVENWTNQFKLLIYLFSYFFFVFLYNNSHQVFVFPSAIERILGGDALPSACQSRDVI